MNRRVLMLSVVVVAALVAAAVAAWVLIGRARQPEPPPTENSRSVELFAPGAAWRYLSADKAPANWNQPRFRDTTWTAGLPAATGSRTVYLRKAATLADVAEVTGAALQVETAAGVTVYLNGERAAEARPTGAAEWRNLDLPTSMLQDGQNLVAVALEGGGDDASFDASMQVFRSSETPVAGPPWRMFTTKNPYGQASGVAVASDGLSLWFNEDFRAQRPGAVYLMEPDGIVRSWVRYMTPTAEFKRRTGSLDTEALAIAGGYMYLADIGNPTTGQPGTPKQQRAFYTITRFPAPRVTALLPGVNAVSPRDIEQIRFTYGTPSWKWRNGEAFVVDPNTGQMLVIEKRSDTDSAPRVYEIPPDWGNQTPVVAPEVTTVKPSIIGISDAAVTPGGGSVWLRDAGKAYEYVVPEGKELVDAFAEPPARTLPLPAQQQGEGLAVDPSGQYLIATSEGLLQAVWGVPLTP